MKSIMWTQVLGSILVATAIAGCASSNANRASRSASATLRTTEVKGSALTLAESISKSPRFARFRQEALARGEEITIDLVDPVRVVGDDYTGDLRTKVEQFVKELPAAFTQRDVGEFTRLGGPEAARQAQLKALADARDFDDNFDKDTGESTTGGGARARLRMEMEGTRDRVPSRSGGFTYDYILRVELYDGKRNTLIFSDSVDLSK